MIDWSLVLARTVDVHLRLEAAGIENAIGGAIALGYHIDDPRGTSDVDVNVSVPATGARRVLEALPDDVPWSEADIARIERDEQIRLMWPIPGAPQRMPLDLFFLAGTLHDVVRTRTVDVPMRGTTVKVLSATDLTIFKALFDRSKDWVDIQSMLDAHDTTVDLEDAVRWVGSIVGEEDPRTVKLASLRTI